MTPLAHVAVLHDVLFAFHAGLALGLRFRDRTSLDEVSKRNDLALDEAALEVCVDRASSLRRRGTLRDGPRAGFFGACGEVGLKAECVEAYASKLRNAALFLANRSKQFSCCLLYTSRCV